MLELVAAASLLAAQPYPTRIRDAEEARVNLGARNSDTEGQRVLNAFGMCAARRNRRSVEAYLAAPFGTPDAERLANRVADEECLESGTLRFSGSLLRGALYDALYNVDYAQRPAADFAAVPRITYVPGDPAALSPEQRDRRALIGFADCTVRAAPAEARALILSNAGTPEERAVFGRIGPHLGPCLPQGVELQFSRPILRGLIAESLYRLSSTPAAPAGVAQ